MMRFVRRDRVGDGSVDKQEEEEEEGNRPAAVVKTGDVKRAPFVALGEFPERYRWLALEDESGQSRCWRIGAQTARQFAEELGGEMASYRMFKTRTVRVFFPIQSSYFAVSSLSLRSTTLVSVLEAVERAAILSVAYHMKADLGVARPTRAEALKVLREMQPVCCYLVRNNAGGSNQVYVRLA